MFSKYSRQLYSSVLWILWISSRTNIKSQFSAPAATLETSYYFPRNFLPLWKIICEILILVMSCFVFVITSYFCSINERRVKPSCKENGYKNITYLLPMYIVYLYLTLNSLLFMVLGSGSKLFFIFTYICIIIWN